MKRILIVGLFLLMLLGVASADLAGYNHTITFNVFTTGSGPAGGSLLLYNTTGQSHDEVFYLGAGLVEQTDWDDIRITYYNDTPCLFNVTAISSDHIETIVNFKNGLTTGNNLFKIQYGNGTVSTGSTSIYNVVVPGSYDAFSGSSVNSTVWNDAGGTGVTGGILTVTGATDWNGVYSKASYGQNYMMIGNFSIQTQAYDGIGFTNQLNFVTRMAQPVLQMDGLNNLNTNNIPDSATTSTLLTDNTKIGSYHTFEIMRNGGTSTTVKIDHNGNAYPITTNIVTDALPVHIGAYTSGGTVNADWVAVVQTVPGQKITQWKQYNATSEFSARYGHNVLDLPTLSE
jgi:hypothetical protein